MHVNRETRHLRTKAGATADPELPINLIHSLLGNTQDLQCYILEIQSQLTPVIAIHAVEEASLRVVTLNKPGCWQLIQKQGWVAQCTHWQAIHDNLGQFHSVTRTTDSFPSY